ncbi:MAG: YeeE/YedE thiosulfate transporter family protein [Gemmatimonadales bacterium]
MSATVVARGGSEALALRGTMSRVAQSYSNPYLAGFGLGLVLLAAFVLMGRGLGASGAFASVAAAVSSSVSPETTRSNDYFARYLGPPGAPRIDWLLIELIGATIGGFVSALFAGRLRLSIERGPRITDASRLRFAFMGGAVMGVGAVLARGCTSGQALTGGALLSVGSWLFMGAAFAAAYAVAPSLKKAWT